MVTLIIDGREVQAEEGAMILDVARENNIDIPALCFHEGVAPFGACRLCLVEIISNGRQRLVASCVYPVEAGLLVKTNTERVLNNRRMIIKLLLAICPNSKVIQDLARRLGVDKTPYELENKNCILCGLCVRVCREVVSVDAIGFISRGIDREIAFPFYESSEVCIGCGSCAYICPVSAIKVEDIGDIRTVSLPTCKTELRLARCKTCGSYWAPQKQLDYIIKKSSLAPEVFDNCPDCRD